MLEAKTKYQGHNVEVFLNKKKQKKQRSSLRNSKTPQNSSVLQKQRSSKNFFREFSGVLQNETTLLLTLAHFQQIKK